MRNATFCDDLHEAKQVINKLSRVHSTHWKSALNTAYFLTFIIFSFDKMTYFYSLKIFSFDKKNLCSIKSRDPRRHGHKAFYATVTKFPAIGHFMLSNGWKQGIKSHDHTE